MGVPNIRLLVESKVPTPHHRLSKILVEERIYEVLIRSLEILLQLLGLRQVLSAILDLCQIVILCVIVVICIDDFRVHIC